MNTEASDRSAYLGGLPGPLRLELLKAFGEITKNYRERRWEPSALNGGKLCEVVYTILRGYVDGAFPKRATKPRNMVDACRALEQAPPSFPRAVRVQIPRALLMLYEVRNNRGVGHVGGDVDPNEMDAMIVLSLSKWIVADLIRVFHDVSPDQAAAAVEGLVQRVVPLVWEVNGSRRVLDASLSMKDKTLLLLYGADGFVAELELVSWVEHSNPSAYRRAILRPAHRAKLLEYDETQR